MVEVNYPAPAQPACLFGQDATLKTYSFWTTLKCFFTCPCYPYPVVYTDGLLSYVVADGKNRTPWGIAIGDYVIAIHAPKEEMRLSEARKSSENVVFAKRQAKFMSIEVLRYVRKKLSVFNKMLETLGGTPFYTGVYPSATFYGKAPAGIDFFAGPGAFLVMDEEDSVYCRPAIDISDLH